jgi:hypothetical protein
LAIGNRVFLLGGGLTEYPGGMDKVNKPGKLAAELVF